VLQLLKLFHVLLLPYSGMWTSARSAVPIRSVSGGGITGGIVENCLQQLSCMLINLNGDRSEWRYTRSSDPPLPRIAQAGEWAVSS
jgi:hypothetical protein